MKPAVIPNVSMKKSPSKSKTLSPGFRVVALGGGTGLSTLLRGLKELVIRRTEEHASATRPISDLAAIVTVTVVASSATISAIFSSPRSRT